MCICICKFSLWKVYANAFYLLHLDIQRLAQDNLLYCIKHRNTSQFYNTIYLYIFYWKSFSSLLWKREQDNLSSLKYSSPWTKLQVQRNIKKFISSELLSCIGSPRYHEIMQQVFFKNPLPNKTWNSSVA